MKLHRILTLTLAIILTAGGAAMAGDFSALRNRHGPRDGFIGLKTLLELKLSDSQEAELLDIITKYQNDRKEVMDSLKAAGKKLSTIVHAEEFNEEDVRKAFREASSLREELFVSRAKMMAEIKTVLNPEQIALLKERKIRRIEKMRGLFDIGPQVPGE
jgi:Spy/CpxP family protein refolding chaperone